MMTVVFSAKAMKRVALLPSRTASAFAQLLLLLREEPFSAKLHTKALSGRLSGLYSFRIARDWRCIFSLRDQETIWIVDVGHRREIYR